MIFLGAGASAPFGIPTAKTLTADIRNLLAEDHGKLLEDINSFWRGTNEKDPNYENILMFLMGLTSPRRIPKGSIVRAFLKDYREHSGDYKAIIDKMYSKIVANCTAPFVSGEKYLSPERLEEIFELTHDILALCRREVVFTTNYDPSIEIWCQKRNIQLLDNTSPTRNPEIREVNRVDEKTIAQGQTYVYPDRDRGEQLTLKAVRLHGSVWTYETEKKKRIKMNRPRDRLLFTDWYSHLKNKPHIIFPGQESVLASGEWDILYQYFRKMLKGNCLVIGYSFQDELINRAFIDNLDKGQLSTIGILTPHPDETLKNLFWGREIPRQKIIQIPAEFGTEHALRNIVTKWVNQILRITFTGGVDGFLNGFRQKMKSYIE